jgi:predicted house-cleaning noncanonical NTP pyrophosphatase (MazG superfamily)
LQDKIDDKIHLSSLSNDNSIAKTNFDEYKFKDNAIMHARTEKELKNLIENKPQNEVPQFLIDRDFSKNADKDEVSEENIMDDVSHVVSQNNESVDFIGANIN